VFIFLFCVKDLFKYLLQCWFSVHELPHLLLWKVFISPSIMEDSFAGYSNPGW
jgi:hypothetical protein